MTVAEPIILQRMKIYISLATGLTEILMETTELQAELTMY
jgi:hypothetical protein